jgi:hypothetical protein
MDEYIWGVRLLMFMALLIELRPYISPIYHEKIGFDIHPLIVMLLWLATLASS